LANGDTIDVLPDVRRQTLHNIGYTLRYLPQTRDGFPPTRYWMKTVYVPRKLAVERFRTVIDREVTTLLYDVRGLV
jgi:hypothetical protein